MVYHNKMNNNLLFCKENYNLFYLLDFIWINVCLTCTLLPWWNSPIISALNDVDNINLWFPHCSTTQAWRKRSTTQAWRKHSRKTEQSSIFTNSFITLYICFFRAYLIINIINRCNLSLCKDGKLGYGGWTKLHLLWGTGLGAQAPMLKQGTVHNRLKLQWSWKGIKACWNDRFPPSGNPQGYRYQQTFVIGVLSTSKMD